MVSAQGLKTNVALSHRPAGGEPAGIFPSTQEVRQMKLNKLAAAVGVILSLAAAAPVVAVAKDGADNPPGDVRGGGGADDGVNHQ
jgi:hypothetical protein